MGHASNQELGRYISRYIPIYHRIGCSKTRKDVLKQEKDVPKQERMFKNRKGHCEIEKDVLKR